MDTRILFLISLLLPFGAKAADWVPLGAVPEARVLLDRESVQVMGDDVMARIKFVYNHVQPAQTISQGSPFDSSINQYYVVCSTQRYQVLELTVLYNNRTVGSYHANLDSKDLEQAKLNTGVMLLVNYVCPKGGTAGARPGNMPVAH